MSNIVTTKGNTDDGLDDEEEIQTQDFTSSQKAGCRLSCS